MAQEEITLLTKADILSATDTKYEYVKVPEWGGTVRVRGLTGLERDSYESSMVQNRGKDVKVNMVNVRAGLVARACIDGAGNRLFSDNDINVLGLKSAVALERVYNVAARLSAISDDDVEKLAGNSASDRSGEPSSV